MASLKRPQIGTESSQKEQFCRGQGKVANKDKGMLRLNGVFVNSSLFCLLKDLMVLLIGYMPSKSDIFQGIFFFFSSFNSPVNGHCFYMNSLKDFEKENNKQELPSPWRRFSFQIGIYKWAWMFSFNSSTTNAIEVLWINSGKGRSLVSTLNKWLFLSKDINY